jgi:hypothetical protein
MNNGGINKSQNYIAEGFLQGSDLDQRFDQIISEITDETGFILNGTVSTSNWWGSKTFGAFHCWGKFQNKRAVLKVQGVKPETSEIEMIGLFNAQNKSQLIRAPKLYLTIPWSNEKRYEVLVMEDVGDKKILNEPTNNKEIKRFFEIYSEYRKKCRNKPWLLKPGMSIGKMIKARFEKWRKSSLEIYPDHPLRRKDDVKLINRAIEILIEKYRGVEWEFQHGHLSDGDLYKVSGGQIVVLSNLYWSWRAPFYDAIFAYHWFIYHLVEISGITPEKIEGQKKMWLNEIFRLFGKNNILLKLALLERAVAGLNLDALSLNPDFPIAKYLVEKTRTNVMDLIDEIKALN